jgi:hypothetical protein
LRAAGSRQLAYTPVFAFAMHNPTILAHFVRLLTDGGDALTVTPLHYVFTLKHAHPDSWVPLERWLYVVARDVVVGDFVPVAAANGTFR